MAEVEVETTAAAEAVPRRINTKKAHLEECGFTAGCLRYRAWLSGCSRQGHSEESRRRLGKQRKDEPKRKVAKERETEFLEKVLRTEDESRKTEGLEGREGVRGLRREGHGHGH